MQRAIEDHMHRARDRRVPALAAAVPKVKASQAREKVGARFGRSAFWISRDTPQGGAEQRAITHASLRPEALFAGLED
jgi:hypothetical protein